MVLEDRSTVASRWAQQGLPTIFQRDLLRLLAVLEMERRTSEGCYEMNIEVRSMGLDKDASCGALIINLAVFKDTAESSRVDEGTFGDPGAIKAQIMQKTKFTY